MRRNRETVAASRDTYTTLRLVSPPQTEPETLFPATTTAVVSPVVSPPVLFANTAQADIQALLAGQLSNETRRAYRGDLKHFLTFIQHPDALDDMPNLPKVLATVDRNTATAYRDHMMTVEKRAAVTVSRRLATITVIYKALCEEGIIARNPFSWVKRPKVGNVGKTPAFTKEQTERILAQPDRSTPMGKRDRVLLLLLFFCGLRRGEVVHVAKDDFYESQGHIMLRVHGKGWSDKTDSVLIPRRIWPEIQAYLETVDGLLFTAQSRNTRYNRADTPISPVRIYFLFKKYCRSAGIDADSFSPHAARATFVTLCLSGGADIRATMEAARHADPATTLRYNRLRLSMERHASNHLHIDLPRTPAQLQYKTGGIISSPV